MSKHDFRWDSIAGAYICRKCGVAKSPRTIDTTCHGAGKPFAGLPATNPEGE